MRNKIAHDYGHVDLELVWEVAKRAASVLVNMISQVLIDYR